MKKILKLLIIVCIFGLFSINAFAVSPEEYINDFENILPDGIFDGKDIEDAGSVVGFDALLSEIYSIFTERGSEIISFLLLLLGGIIIMSVASSLGGELYGMCEAGVGLVFSTLIFGRIAEIFLEVRECAEATASFFTALVPIMTGISVASGSGAVATVQNTGMTLTLFIITSVAIPIFTSITGFAMAMSLITSFGDETAFAVTRGVKSAFTFCVSALTTTLGAVMSLQTVVASASDSAAMRAIRYAASGMIPVVGSAVSSSLSTLSAGLGYVKSIVGAGGITVILALTVSPLLMLLLYRLALSLAVGVSDMCLAPSASRVFGAFRSALDTIIAVHAMCSVIFIFEIIVFMKGGAALV
ncbi:MAG: hypothetical protein IJX92_06740 [Clostridia bacterium]|nr:hypothetical protein [Clostridia bacterium]